MSKIYLPLTVAAAALIIPLRAPARTLSPAEALNRIAAESNSPARAAALGGTSARLVLKDAVRAEKAVDPAMYVFQNNADGGYVIASADDAFPAVIGYPSHYSADPDSIAPGLQWYLETVAANIEAVRAGAASSDNSTADPSYRADWKDVQQLITTNWKQSSPYNQQVPYPSATNLSSKRRVGCVAVAMGQLMRYHRHPKTGTGSNSYIIEANGKTFFRNFDQRTYNWNNMPDEITSSSSSTYRNAIANLLADVGCSVDMQYKYNSSTGKGSGSSETIRTVYALTTYFGYSNDIRYHWQGFGMTQAEWETEVYNSLANNRPVIYAGCIAEGGHAFICDGYRKSDNKFHINWGWGGDRSDSKFNGDYFNLTLLNPQGSSELHDYSYHQLIITNIHPATSGETTQLQEPFIGFYGDLHYGTYNGKANCFYAHEEAMYDSSDGTYRDDGFLNLSPEYLVIQFGIIAEDPDKGTQYLIHKEPAEKYTCKKGPEYMQIDFDALKRDLPGKLPMTTYRLYPAYRIDDGSAMAPALKTADATATGYELPAGWKKMNSLKDEQFRTYYLMNVFSENDPQGRTVEIGTSVGNGLTTGVTDIVAEGGVDAEAVLQVVRPDGTVVAVSPSAAQLDALPAGLYIYVTPAGPRKVMRR